MTISEQKFTLRPTPTALLNPCVDVIFKALFTQNTEDSNCALMSFLSSVIGKKVVSVQILPEEPSVIDARDKAVRFDVSCTFNDGLSADIEMQRENNDHSFCKRAEYLSARLLVHAVQSGNEWFYLKPVYQISIVDFFIDKNNNNLENWYVMQ